MNIEEKHAAQACDKRETLSEPSEQQGLIKEAIRILDLSEGAHRRATPKGKEAFKDACWKLLPEARVFIGRLYDFGKEFRGNADNVLAYWEENETNVVEAGIHMVPHLIYDPMVEIYIVRALGILQAEGILHNTGVKCHDRHENTND
jgi:hypothetical protein